jgi:outer membrane biosynthesis protein TonB
MKRAHSLRRLLAFSLLLACLPPREEPREEAPPKEVEAATQPRPAAAATQESPASSSQRAPETSPTEPAPDPGGASGGAGHAISYATSGPPLQWVKEGEPSIRGVFSKKIVRRVVKRSLPRFAFCYEKARQRDQTLGGGTLTIKFIIGADGKVFSAEVASGRISAEVDACVVEKTTWLEFPAPEKGGTVEVSYPFTFFVDAASR